MSGKMHKAVSYLLYLHPTAAALLWVAILRAMPGLLPPADPMHITETIFLTILFIEGLGGSIGTFTVLEWQRRSFSMEIARMKTQHEAERVQYRQDIAELKAQVQLLMRLVPDAALKIAAEGSVSIEGDVVARDKRRHGE